MTIEAMTKAGRPPKVIREQPQLTGFQAAVFRSYFVLPTDMSGRFLPSEMEAELGLLGVTDPGEKAIVIEHWRSMAGLDFELSRKKEERKRRREEAKTRSKPNRREPWLR